MSEAGAGVSPESICRTGFVTPSVFLICLSVLGAFISGTAIAQTSDTATGGVQRLEIPSTFNPVGSGARALGMGNAFIAVADDATAASWNPGGLIQLGCPEVSVVGAFFQIKICYPVAMRRFL